MDAELLQAETQYGDCRGTVSIDGWQMAPFHDIAQSIGIDVDRYWPINISFSALDPGGARSDARCSVVIDVIDSEIAGKNWDEVVKYINARNGQLQTIRYRKYGVDPLVLLNHVKRFNMTLQRTGVNIKGLQPAEEQELPSAE